MNELTVIAWGSPPWLVVTTVTPVAKWPNILRNSAASKDMGPSLSGFASGKDRLRHAGGGAARNARGLCPVQRRKAQSNAESSEKPKRNASSNRSGEDRDVDVLRESRARAELRDGLRARTASRTRDVDVTGIVVPRGNAVPPPELPRDAPVLDVVDPVQVRRQPLARARTGRGRLVRCPGRRGRRRRRQGTGPGSSCPERTDASAAPGLHRDEPLVGQHRLDDFAGAAASRHDHPVRLLADDEPCAKIREPGFAPRSDRDRDTSPARWR